MKDITVNVDIDITAEDEEDAEKQVKEALDKSFPDEYTIRSVESDDD